VGEEIAGPEAAMGYLEQAVCRGQRETDTVWGGEVTRTVGKSAFGDLAVGARGVAHDAAEAAGEIVGIGKAGERADGGDRRGGGVEELAGALDAEADEPVDGGKAGLTFEDRAVMRDGNGGELGEFFEADGATRSEAEWSARAEIVSGDEAERLRWVRRVRAARRAVEAATRLGRE